MPLTIRHALAAHITMPCYRLICRLIIYFDTTDFSPCLIILITADFATLAAYAHFHFADAALLTRYATPHTSSLRRFLRLLCRHAVFYYMPIYA